MAVFFLVEPFCSKMESPNFYAGSLFVYHLFLKAIPHPVQQTWVRNECKVDLKKISYCVVRTGKVPQSTMSEGSQCCLCSPFDCDSYHFNANNRHNNCPQQIQITVGWVLSVWEIYICIRALLIYPGPVWLQSIEIRIIKVLFPKLAP